jgi:hypothetical protein
MSRFIKGLIQTSPEEPTFSDANIVGSSRTSGIFSIEEQLEAKRSGSWTDVDVPNPNLFVETNFTVTLYEGTGAAQTITNNLDNTNAMIWIKNTEDTDQPTIIDTINWTGATGGRDLQTRTDSTAVPNTGSAAAVTSINNQNFTLGSGGRLNRASDGYVCFTWRVAPKFFDMVQYTGTGSAQAISHSLTTAPGMIWIKRKDATSNFAVYHRANTAAPQTDYLILNTDAATADSANWWNDTAPTTSVFTVGTDASVNADGGVYTAYIFGHETDAASMIHCGGYTGNGGSQNIDVGFEAQWVMIKNTQVDNTNWMVVNRMREFVVGSGQADDSALLTFNTTAAETGLRVTPHPEGFGLNQEGSSMVNASNTYVYCAIRAPMMQTITDATKVFALETLGATNSSGVGDGVPGYVSGFPVDMLIQGRLDEDNRQILNRQFLNKRLFTNLTNAQSTENDADFYFMDGCFTNTSVDTNRLGLMWRRAKSYFDIVCYIGTGSATTFAHNLGVVPEMMWVKRRDGTGQWAVYHSGTDASPATKRLYLNLDNLVADENTPWNDTAPTASVFTVGAAGGSTNDSGEVFVAFLFATLAGVSKVGSVTHSGSSTDVDCGFTAGSRFILLKRTDADGSWFWWSSVMGIIAGNDPYSTLDTNAAQVTNTDFIDPLASGFTITGDFTDGDYIFYAIA